MKLYIFDNCARVRLALGLKGLAFETEFVAYTDVEKRTVVGSKFHAPAKAVPAACHAVASAIRCFTCRHSSAPRATPGLRLPPRHGNRFLCVRTNSRDSAPRRRLGRYRASLQRILGLPGTTAPIHL